MNFKEHYLTENNKVTLYHGTLPKKVSLIKQKGLESPSGYDSANWFMLSTDFESALYHATPENKSSVFVVEFEVPFEKSERRWEGYPYLWPGEKRNDKSIWYALKQPLPKEFIKKIHEVPYEDYIQQKEKGF